jgi:CHASE2 domain-containing sensor protein
MSIEERYWFRAKRHGLGWGLPCSWQGWAFFLAWLATLVMVAISLMPRRPFLFALTLGAMTLILVAVCYIKGEPLLGGSGKNG